MRGQTFFSYALVVFATTASAAPVGLEVRVDDALEAREPYVAKVGIVNPGQGYVESRQVADEEDDEEEDYKVKRQLEALTGLLGGAGGPKPAGGAGGAAGANPLAGLLGGLTGGAGGAAGANPLAGLLGGAAGGAGGANPLAALTGALPRQVADEDCEDEEDYKLKSRQVEDDEEEEEE